MILSTTVESAKTNADRCAYWNFSAVARKRATALSTSFSHKIHHCSPFLLCVCPSPPLIREKKKSWKLTPERCVILGVIRYTLIPIRRNSNSSPYPPTPRLAFFFKSPFGYSVRISIYIYIHMLRTIAAVLDQPARVGLPRGCPERVPVSRVRRHLPRGGAGGGGVPFG